MRTLWIILLALTAVPLAGCESIGAIWSAALFIPGLFLVIIIWLVAYFTIRVRGD
jgi:hypothetical protein